MKQRDYTLILLSQQQQQQQQQTIKTLVVGSNKNAKINSHLRLRCGSPLILNRRLHKECRYGNSLRPIPLLSLT